MSSSTPDLASVLQTLAQLAPATANHASNTVTSQTPSTASFPNYGAHQYSYEPPGSSRPADPRLRADVLRAAHGVADVTSDRSRSATPTIGTQQKAAGIDPSTITEWPAALKYVMRTVSQNEEIQKRIKKLITTQHEHERQWWAGRELIIKQQEESKKQGDQDIAVCLKCCTA